MKIKITEVHPNDGYGILHRENEIIGQIYEVEKGDIRKHTESKLIGWYGVNRAGLRRDMPALSIVKFKRIYKEGVK